MCLVARLAAPQETTTSQHRRADVNRRGQHTQTCAAALGAIVCGAPQATQASHCNRSLCAHVRASSGVPVRANQFGRRRRRHIGAVAGGTLAQLQPQQQLCAPPRAHREQLLQVAGAAQLAPARRRVFNSANPVARQLAHQHEGHTRSVSALPKSSPLLLPFRCGLNLRSKWGENGPVFLTRV